MGREVKRVASDFDWPLEKVWAGYKNPFYKYCEQCYDCQNGYSPRAYQFYQEWYGYAEFDPVAYGSKLLTQNHPAVKQFVERMVDRSICEEATGKKNYYTFNGLVSREEAIKIECKRLTDMWDEQWSHHLIQADVDALIESSELWDFTRRPLPQFPLEEYIRTHAYYLWIDAGRPDGDAEKFWLTSEEKHKGYWLPFDNGYRPTVEEVTNYGILSPMGLSGGAQYVCVKARCEREGIDPICSTCGGSSEIWYSAETKQQYEEWEKEEPPTGEAYQVWETVSEGSPISPAFVDPRILAEWMSTSKYSQNMSAEKWLAFITGPGWAPSGILENNVYLSGVEAAVNNIIAQ